jgi:uridine phosphorylase
MDFPHYSGKQRFPGIFGASDIFSLRGKDVKDRLRGATSAVVCFQSSLVKYLSGTLGGREADGFSGTVLVLKKAGHPVVLAQPSGIGAPAVALLLEELAASGTRRCIAVGVAGALQASIKSGECIIPTEAIRDEGTSHHYLPADVHASPSDELLRRFTSALDQRGKNYISGKIWTTDAPYRETAEEIARYEKEGILTVDMEMSAFLCVCSALKMEAACALVAADSLAGGIWHPPADIKKVNSSLEQLGDAAIEALVA